MTRLLLFMISVDIRSLSRHRLNNRFRDDMFPGDGRCSHDSLGLINDIVDNRSGDTGLGDVVIDG